MKCESLQLNFEGYEVIKANLEKIKDVDKLDNESNIGFLIKIIPNKNKNFDKVNIILGIQIQPSIDFNYKVETIVKGNFMLSNCKSDEERMQYVLVNCSAILFPYVRSYISMFTSQLSCEQLVLPIMNLYETIDSIPIGELLIDASQFEQFK